MTFLLSNDDGIDALGIAAMADALTQLGHTAPVFIAPDREQSGCGHRVTTRTPIAVETRDDRHHAISGTPADCVRLGLHALCPEASWVLSGINAGGNMGVDIYLSGTLAAVREGAMHGVPGIGISQYLNWQKPMNWEKTTAMAVRVLAALLDRGCERGTYWNVNLPHLDDGAPEPELVFCQSSTSPLLLDYRVAAEGYQYQGNYQMREALPGTDVATCFAGNIAIVKLSL
ncbi:MAG: 5'/3'-nucleotidase SurE [Geitlerinemataceae cyanobacterium]